MNVHRRDFLLPVVCLPLRVRAARRKLKVHGGGGGCCAQQRIDKVRTSLEARPSGRPMVKREGAVPSSLVDDRQVGGG